MSDNSENPRRDRFRPEDNPFIAFRRFADSSVSSLMNSVFTIPATIANYNNVHQAREACLFKRAENSQCEKLQEIEGAIASLRREGKEMLKAGDLKEVMKRSEELMWLDRQADELRQEIIGQSQSHKFDENDKVLIHRVANKKGQEWGWDWSWGFPKPFDSESNPQPDNVDQWNRQQLQRLEQARSEAREFFNDEGWNDAAHTVFGALESNPMFRAMKGEKSWDEFKDFIEVATKEDKERGTYSRSWQFPPPTDARRREEVSKYSPEALEADENMQKTGVNWSEAYKDLLRTEKDEDKRSPCPWRRRRMASGYQKRVPWEGEETAEEPSYEYSHDHEDQHDDPPTPRPTQKPFAPTKQIMEDKASWTITEDHDLQEFLSKSQDEKQRLLAQTEVDSQPQNVLGQNAETELDAYEHFMSAPKSSITKSSNPTAQIAGTVGTVQPSILSTLTTTERTVAPDGSVTTKVVLKKRFADGREESSETVHTHRGQEPTPTFHEAWAKPDAGKAETKEAPRRSGWFWSS